MAVNNFTSKSDSGLLAPPDEFACTQEAVGSAVRRTSLVAQITMSLLTHSPENIGFYFSAGKKGDTESKWDFESWQLLSYFPSSEMPFLCIRENSYGLAKV